jgi:hypothetical protein
MELASCHSCGTYNFEMAPIGFTAVVSQMPLYDLPFNDD